MKTASFNYMYYKHGLRAGRKVNFYRDSATGKYVASVEGYPALRITHPSRNRVLQAFVDYFNMAIKDWGTTDFEPGDYITQEEINEHFEEYA